MSKRSIARESYIWSCGLWLILGCMIQSLPALAQPNAKLPTTERTFIASRVYSIVQLYFSGLKALPELDLDGAYRNYLETALAADDRREFDLATMEFLARLRNSHTTLWDSWLTNRYGQPIGFYARPSDGQWVVENSAVPNLQRGDVLSKIDGVDTETFFRQRQKYISGSNEAAQRRDFFSLTCLFPQQLTLTLDDGRSVRIDRAVHRSTERQTKPDGHWVRPDTLAYIRIPSFDDPSAEERSLAYVVQFAKAKTIVFDVRNNPGGLVPRRLLRALMDRPYRDWKISTPVHVSVLELTDRISRSGHRQSLTDFDQGYLSASAAIFGGSQLQWGGGVVSPDNPLFHGEIIFLIDGGCASACEELVGPFKENHRATLVGETTEGSSGPSYEEDLGDGITIGIAATRQFFPDGTEFEGVGIKPDYEMRPSVSDLKAGRDVVLEKAVELHAKP